MPDSSPTLGIDAADAVDVAVPLDNAHAATLRVLVTSLAADAGFSIDEIDDVKLAVSEVFTLLVDAAEESDTGGRAQIRLIPTVGSLTVTLASDRAAGGIELDPLATTILSSVIDDYVVADSGVTLVKRSAETSP